MAEGTRGESDRVKPRVQSVARAVRILNEIARSPEGLTAQELSRLTGINRATMYHLLHTLGIAGYVVGTDAHRYRIGLGISGLVAAFERQVLPGGLLPLARQLASQTGETAYVAARQGSELVLLCSVPGHHPVGVANSPVGPIHDGHARASGKLLLALAPDDVQKTYLRNHPLKKLTPETITSRAQLMDKFDEIRSAGFAMDDGEYSEGVCCVAAPLAGGASVIAVALSAPRERFEEHRDEYIAATLDAAQADAGGVPVAS